jgi:hypothetical protein
LRKAHHSLIQDLGLDRMAKMTPWKKKLDDRIKTRESVVCILRKKLWRRQHTRLSFRILPFRGPQFSLSLS